MRTTWATWLVFSLVLSTTVFGLSGFGSFIGGNPAAGQSPDADKFVGNVSPEEGVGGSARQGDDGFFGLITGGSQTLTNVLGNVLILPNLLSALGFPPWFAGPAGTTIQFVAGIGLLQFTLNRVYK